MNINQRVTPAPYTLFPSSPATTSATTELMDDDEDAAEDSEDYDPSPFVHEDSLWTSAGASAVSGLQWVLGFALSAGLVRFIHLPALRTSLEQLSAERARPLAERSDITQASAALTLASASSSIAALTLEQLSSHHFVQTATSNLKLVARNVSKIQIPFVLYRTANDMKMLRRTVNEFRRRDGECFTCENILGLTNPADMYMQDVAQKDLYKPIVKSTALSIATRCITTPVMLMGYGWSALALNRLSSAYIDSQARTTETAVSMMDTERLDVQLTSLIVSLVSPLTANDMKPILACLGAGSYLSWQSNGAKYSDVKEIKFLKDIISQSVGKGLSIVSTKDKPRALKAIEDIYGDFSYPQFAMRGSHYYVKGDKLREFLVLLREARRLDINSGRKRRMGGPFAQSPNNVYKMVMVAAIEVNSVSVNRL